MKKMHVVLIAVAGIGAGYLVLRSMKKASAMSSGLGGSESPFRSDIVGLPNPTMPAGQGTGTPTDAVAQGGVIQEGFPPAVAPTTYLDTFFSRLNYLGEQKNPLTGEPQAVFARIDNQGSPAGARFNVDGKQFFIEQVPVGAASSSKNVVLLTNQGEIGFHTVKGSAKGPLKPGDEGYDAAVTKARASIEEMRRKSGVVEGSTGKPAAGNGTQGSGKSRYSGQTFSFGSLKVKVK